MLMNGVGESCEEVTVSGHSLQRFRCFQSGPLDFFCSDESSFFLGGKFRYELRKRHVDALNIVPLKEF